MINLSTHAMPPLRMFCKDFLSSLVMVETNKADTIKALKKEKALVVDSMEISDDEEEPADQQQQSNDPKFIRRRALKKEEELIKENSTKRKEAATKLNSIENKLKHLNLQAAVESFVL